MADYDAPSFSLGIDFDPNLPSCSATVPESCQTFQDDDTCFEPKTLFASDFDPPRVLKRLKRGLSKSLPRTCELKSVQFSNNDDEIEEFSSQEDPCRKDEHISTQNRYACSSSKISLHGHQALITQSANKLNTKMKSPTSNVLMFTTPEASINEKLPPKTTISPLRKIQSLDSDSDSDEPSACENKFEDNKTVFSGSPEKTGTKFSSKSLRTESLWEDFCPQKKISLATPALDEFCEEYFGSLNGVDPVRCKEGELSTSRSKPLISDKSTGCFQKNKSFDNAGNPLPPAYGYFCNDDSRIRKLVCDRLPNFFPIDAVNHFGSQQPETVNLDYKSQFGQHDVPRQTRGTARNHFDQSSNTRRKHPNNVKSTEASQASGSWVNPRSSVPIPRDAGKRRVCAVGQSAGHWYSGEDGRKVYVNKNGQELTGQIAYRHYMKERGGASFRKTRKKPAPKKKSR